MKKIACLAAAMLATMTLVGCGSESIERVTDPEKQLLTMEIGPTDLNAVAEAIRNQIQTNPNLMSGGKTLLVRVQPFDNQTGSTTFMMQELVDTVVSVLTNSGKMAAITDDPAAYEAFVLKRKMAGQSGTHLEDYTLTGRVTLQEETRGNARQHTYYFNFKLNDTNSGTMAMNGQHRVIKVQKRGGMGF